MRMKFIAYALLLMPYTAHAVSPSIPDVAAATTDSVAASAGQSDTNGEQRTAGSGFAADRRFYIGGDYAIGFWESDIVNGTRYAGKTGGGFDAMAGVRLYDWFRVEANYHNFDAKWDNLSMSGDAVFVNAIFDARINSTYRFFRRQYFVPYVGLGIGMSSNTADGTDIKNKTSMAYAGMAGIAVEFNDTFALDFGYRYMYLAAPEFVLPGGVAKSFAPVAHQVRAGVRISF